MANSSYALPLHRLSIGDTIQVNFEGDRRWYSAEIVEANGDHECEVLYKDGEREWIDLEKVKFRVSRNWSGSIRKRSKIEKSNVKEEEEAYEIEEIRDVLFNNGKVKELVCRRSNRLKQSTLDENICLKNSAGDHGQEEVAFRRSNRLKEKSKLDEKSCLRNSTGDLEHMEDPASPLHLTESEEASDSAYTPSSMYYCRKSTERLIRRKSKGSDKYQYKTDEPLNDCSSGDSSTSSTCIKSDGLPCSFCESTDGRSFLIQCRNSTCFRTFHTFCLRPPLQTIENDWVCPICHGGSFIKNLAEDKKQIAQRIHKIVGHKRVIMDDQKKLFQDQFLIKWASLSHHQDSWVPREWLYAFSPVRMHSYLKKCHQMSRSDFIDERKPEWFKIDRVISCRRKCDSDKPFEILDIGSMNQENGDLEFLVKWMGLDYCDSTWESSCSEELLPEVSRLIQRHQRATERVDNSSTSSGSEALNKIPNELYGGALYDYQLQGQNWILKNFKARRNVILADEMGLGKTIQVVSFIRCMKQEKLNIDPILIIAPKSILFQWEKEFRYWAKDLNVIIYQGEKQSRQCIRTHEMHTSGKYVLFDALITNYELVILDMSTLRKFRWSAIVIDEAHKIKRLDCKLASCLKLYSSDFRLLLTGTPLQNTLLELFVLLNYIDPERFSDPEAEAESYKSIKSLSPPDIEKKIAEIHELLRPRMLRRMKSDVLPGSIPVKKWVEVPCALTDYQRELYINILEKNHEKLSMQIQNGRKSTLKFILMELKKCCNHPYIFPGMEPCLSSEDAIFSSLVSASGKLQLLEKLLPRLKNRGNRVLLFSQMVKMLDILEDFLMFLGMSYFRIDGSTPVAARQEQMRDFNDPNSQVFVFLISTRAGGLGIDLPTADRVIIYDPDFNPFNDLQAQSRAHRIGQTRPVVVYQLITKCSVEVKILQKSKEKLAIENLVMNPSKIPSVNELHSVLLHGARTILNKENIKATTIHYDDKAIDALLKLDPEPGGNCSPDDNGYLGSIQNFVTEDNENGKPSSPKAKEWENILGPVEDAKEEDGNLGRGKRQKKKEVNYECEESDSDDIYSPESSSSSDSDDSDFEAAYDEM